MFMGVELSSTCLSVMQWRCIANIYIYNIIYIYIINGLTPWCRRPPFKGGVARAGPTRFLDGSVIGKVG